MVENSADKMVARTDALWVGWKVASMVVLRVVVRGATTAVEMAGSRVAW